MIIQVGLGTYRCLDCLDKKAHWRSERCRICAQRKRWTKPGVCEKHGQSVKKAWAKSEVQKAHQKVSESPEYRKRQGEATRMRMADPEQKAAHDAACRTPEFRAKERISHSTPEYLATMSGPGNPMFGKRRPDISDRNKKYCGSKNHFWRDGASYKSYGKEFTSELKSYIRDRDDHMCQNLKCYKSENGKKHPVHHIDFIKTHNDFFNLIELCDDCHQLTIHGDWDYWMDYYQNVQLMRGIEIRPRSF